MQLPDLSITISHRRWACVLDPALVLSRFGVPLIQRLDDVMELWIVRELWHILDNSRFYLNQPKALFSTADEGLPAWREPPDDGEITWAMKEWERIRKENDLSGLKMYWLNDCFADSLTPEGQAPDLLPRFESLACTLDRHLGSTGPMACAARDSVALAAALGTAFVLTYQTADEAAAHLPPNISKVFADSIEFMPVRQGDPIAAIEQNHLRHLLVHSGVANLLWAGLHLTVIHVAAPMTMPLPFLSHEDAEREDIDASLPQGSRTSDPWDGVRAFWYPL
jgi:hypothetical protein